MLNDCFNCNLVHKIADLIPLRYKEVIALDYDVYILAPDAWDQIIPLFNIPVIFTVRHDVDNPTVGKREIVLCDLHNKRDMCRSQGYQVSVWIDCEPRGDLHWIPTWWIKIVKLFHILIKKIGFQ